MFLLCIWQEHTHPYTLKSILCRLCSGFGLPGGQFWKHPECQPSRWQLWQLAAFARLHQDRNQQICYWTDGHPCVHCPLLNRCHYGDRSECCRHWGWTYSSSGSIAIHWWMDQHSWCSQSCYRAYVPIFNSIQFISRLTALRITWTFKLKVTDQCMGSHWDQNVLVNCRGLHRSKRWPSNKNKRGYLGDRWTKQP